MNEHFYMPLPVAALEIGRERPNREKRRLFKKTLRRYEKGKPKTQLPKRRAKPFGKHNKDRYHK